MPNDGRIMVCPYYHYTRKSKIVCEDVPRRFRYRKHMERWLDKHCCDDWQGCMYAKVLNQIYEKGGDMTQHTIDELKRELHKADTRIGRQEAQIKSRDEQIKELRKKNRALEDRAARLSQSEENERKLSEFIGKLTEFYESRFAYLMDQFNAGELRESDYEKWGEGKQYAIIETRDGEERVWKAIVEESEDDIADPNDGGAGTEDEEEQPADHKDEWENDDRPEQDVPGV